VLEYSVKRDLRSISIVKITSIRRSIYNNGVCINNDEEQAG